MRIGFLTDDWEEELSEIAFLLACSRFAGCFLLGEYLQFYSKRRTGLTSFWRWTEVSTKISMGPRNVFSLL